jgi:hypothetical protein
MGVCAFGFHTALSAWGVLMPDIWTLAKKAKWASGLGFVALTLTPVS